MNHEITKESIKTRLINFQWQIFQNCDHVTDMSKEGSSKDDVTVTVSAD